MPTGIPQGIKAIEASKMLLLRAKHERKKNKASTLTLIFYYLVDNIIKVRGPVAP